MPDWSPFILASSSRTSMEIDHGGDVIAAMGYVIIDRNGVLRQRVQDPLFGNHADRILKSLREL